MKRQSAWLASLLVMSTAMAQSETFRCGRWVVDKRMSPPELLRKCGAPTKREVEDREVWVPLRHGTGTRKIIVQVETWRYDRGQRAADMVVTVIDGRIEEMRRDK